MSLFPSGSKIVITGGSFVQNNDAAKELTPLYDKVAPNAILNAGGRADPVRCHPGTRGEVIAKIEKWIKVTHAEGRGIFWLSGPAGAGKSAIIQTIAEGCIERQGPMANFFFFRADNTRNHSGPVVATLLFQLFNLFPELRPHVAAIATQNPVIFRQSMAEQFSTLIEMPLLAIRPSSDSIPLVILIDGLDECSSENSNIDQTSLLYILHDIATRSASPAFIVLVASRTESHLTMAFKEIGCHPDSIYLDDSYRPSDDIRVFLIQEFARIKRMHSLSDTLPANWPPSTDLDTIIKKSSGQFVYAATVIRFIFNSAASPKRSLEIVLGLRLVTRTSPFATLDNLYTYILSQAEDWGSVHDILAAEKFISIQGRGSLPLGLAFLLRPLGYTEDDILSSLSDLTAIIRFHTGDINLTLYHASLNDFLYDEHRAGHFYINMNAFACRLAPPHFKQITNSRGLYWSLQILGCVTEPDTRLLEFLESFSPKLLPRQNMKLDQQQLMRTALARLYQSRDPELYKVMVIRWEEWFDIVDSSSRALPYGSVFESSSPMMAPRTVSGQRSLRPSTPPSPAQAPPPRPSTPPSRCFPIFTLRRKRKV